MTGVPQNASERLDAFHAAAAKCTTAQLAEQRAKHGGDRWLVKQLDAEISARRCASEALEPATAQPVRQPLRVVANEPEAEPEREPIWWEAFPPWGDYPDVPPPLLTRDDGHPLIPGEGHVEILGAWGSGKSWLAQRCAVEALRAGRPTVYLRLEGHQRGLHQRLRMLGLKDDVIRDGDRFRSVCADYLPEHRRWAERWLAGGVLVIDTVSRAGGSTNEADEAEAWLAANVNQFTDRGCLVLSVDHVSKNFPDDLVAMSSRGSSAKTAAADFALHVVGHRKHGKRPVPTCWSPGSAGHVKLYVGKPDRNGHIDADGPHGGLATLRGGYDPASGAFGLRIDAPEAEAADNDSRAEPLGAILAAAAATPGLTARQLARKAIAAGFPQRRSSEAVSAARDDGLLRGTPGPRGSIAHVVTPLGSAMLPAAEPPDRP